MQKKEAKKSLAEEKEDDLNFLVDKEPKKRNWGCWIIILIIIAVIAGLAAFQPGVLESGKNKAVNYLKNIKLVDFEQTSEESQEVVLPEEKEEEVTIKLNCPEKYTQYVSRKWRIGFCYPEEISEIGAPVRVSEEKNKIYVWIDRGDKADKEGGQFMEIFNKDDRDTLTEALQKEFLKDVPSDQCWAQLSSENPGEVDYPSNYVFADGLSYPPSEDPNEPFFANQKNCPEGYRSTNGIRYFLMDKKYPDRFIFFSIGQYGIGEFDKPMWQETIKIFSLR